MAIFYQDDESEGVITTLFDRDGNEVSDLREAVACVVQVLRGPHAGKWLVAEIDESDFFPITLN